MGFMWCFAECIGCRVLFGFNPERVPSIYVDGEKQPVCGVCMAMRNKKRREQGLAEDEVMQGAYEAVDESEV
jgi:hypothetical protein